MKQTVDLYTFRNAFQNLRPDNFSHEGLEVLFDYLEEYESATGEELELDVIAICCDFSEDAADSIARSYNIDVEDCEDADEVAEAVKEYLEDEGAFIGESFQLAEGGSQFVYRSF